MAYKITGKVLLVGPTQTLHSKSGKDYSKRDLIITARMFDQYTGEPTDDTNNTPKFTFFGDRCLLLDGIGAEDIVTVTFEISGRSYSKDNRLEYFTEVRPIGVYKAKSYEVATTSASEITAPDSKNSLAEQAQAAFAKYGIDVDVVPEGSDKLPF